MPELCVTITYTSPVKDRLLLALQWTLPVWGLCPLIAAMQVVYRAQGMSTSAITALCLAFLIPAVVLLLIRYLTQRSIVLDKNGIQLPPSIHDGLKSRYLPWSSIDRISYTGDHLLLNKAGSKPLVVDTRMIEPAQLDRMLVTLDLLSTSMDESVESLRRDLRLTQNNAGALEGPSYTDIWEEELSRRFRPAAFMPLEVGVILRNGTLTIERQLALGGLSAVYLGTLNNGERVVVKESVVPQGEDDALKQKAREMFEREARLLLKLEHPNIVKVMDYFVEADRSYLMLGHVPGMDLKQHVRQSGVFASERVLKLAVHMTDILQYLHENDPPVLHRDFTPDNLVLDPTGQIVAIDFGAANEFIGTATGTFVGKQSYIAPEQFRGKAEPASDIYALGGTLFFMLTGSDPVALTASDPGEAFDQPLRQLILDCTHVEPARRINSAAELRKQLLELQKG